MTFGWKINDLYDSLPEQLRDDKLALIYETNVENPVAINPGVGQTDRVSIPRVVQQAGGWGPMECSNSVDTLGKRCKTRGIHSYLYKGRVRVLLPPWYGELHTWDSFLWKQECGTQHIYKYTYRDEKAEIRHKRYNWQE